MSTDRDLILSELLIIRHRRGDSAALDELIRLWEDKIFYYIRRLLDDEEDAWDALQETWVAMVQGIDRLREPGGFALWLYRTARNKAMNRLRRKYSDEALLAQGEKLIEADEGAEEFSFEDAEQVHRAMSKLSLPHREALTLHFLEDLSIDDISQVLSVSPGTVKSRLHYAKRALKTILEEEGYTS